MTAPGRPTKLNAERHQRLVQAVAGGNSQDVAARSVGVHPATFQRWLARGRPADPDSPKAPSRADRPYRRLWEDVEEARGRAESRMVVAIQSAALTDWRAAAWYLERSRPEQWGRSTRLEHVGDGGGPVQLLDVGLLPPDAAGAAHQLLSMAAGEETSDEPDADAADVDGTDD